MSKIVWLGTSTVLTLGKEILLRDTISGVVVPDASTARATVYNETQNLTVGVFTLTPEDVTPGRYRGIIPYNQGDLAIGDRLRIEFFADAGSSKRLTIALKASVKMRTG